MAPLTSGPEGRCPPQRPSQGASSSKPRVHGAARVAGRGVLRSTAWAPASQWPLSLAHLLAFPAGTPWRHCRPACSETWPRRPWV